METVKIAIIGYGTIGSGVAEVLEKQKKLITARTGKVFEVCKILDVRDFSLHPMKDRFVTTIDEIIKDSSISIVAEAIGGVNPAYEYTMKCIAAKKHVVTSNKELVATKGVEILSAAEMNNVGFLFEASVGGTIPIISSMLGVLSANSIERIDGILNGTTNFILTNMLNKKLSFDEALERAQDLGYAETIDPSADIDGIDAQRKISILASLAFGHQIPVEKIETEGIRNVTYEDLLLADGAEGTIKLISSAQGDYYGEAWACVKPVFVHKGNRFASVDDVNNSVCLHYNMSGTIELFGRGAGKLPTAAVVVGDILELATKEISRPILWSKAIAGEGSKDEIVSKYFVSAHSEDKSVVEKISKQVEAASSTEYAVGFFTASITKEAAVKMKEKLERHNVTVKLYQVLED